MEIGQDFKEFIELLNKHKVQYMVVGGYAVALYGFPRYTGDIDFWIKPDKLNAQHIVDALIDFGFGAVDIAVSDFETENKVIQLGIPPNRIDILTSVDGLTFEESWNQKEVIQTEGALINYISLHHLRLNKASSNREKDQLDLKNLPKA
jgi:hypothetical protein